jgi:hypothetical protein
LRGNASVVIHHGILANPIQRRHPLAPCVDERKTSSLPLRRLAGYCRSESRFYASRVFFDAVISTDEGRAWKLITTLEDGPHRWYCSVAMPLVRDCAVLGHGTGDHRQGTSHSANHTISRGLAVPTRFKVVKMQKHLLRTHFALIKPEDQI